MNECVQMSVIERQSQFCLVLVTERVILSILFYLLVGRREYLSSVPAHTHTHTHHTVSSNSTERERDQGITERQLPFHDPNK